MYFSWLPRLYRVPEKTNSFRLMPTFHSLCGRHLQRCSVSWWFVYFYFLIRIFVMLWRCFTHWAETSWSSTQTRGSPPEKLWSRDISRWLLGDKQIDPNKKHDRSKLIVNLMHIPCINLYLEYINCIYSNYKYSYIVLLEEEGSYLFVTANCHINGCLILNI